MPNEHINSIIINQCLIQVTLTLFGKVLLNSDYEKWTSTEMMSTF